MHNLYIKMVQRYSIKDLEKLSGVKAHTIRIWEKRYGIITPERTGTNIRFYNNDDLRQILNISLLNKNGYKISVVAKMSAQERVDYIAGLSKADINHDAVQENLLLSLIEMNEAGFNQTFSALNHKMGFEHAMVNIVFPFFERIGVMWQAGTIEPAQEHFFSNLIRQKLIAATDILPVNTTDHRESVLLFLPENEMHEIGLLFYNYALKARGFCTIYLGQSVPLQGLEKIINTCRPDYVVTSMTSALNTLTFQEFLNLMMQLLPANKVFYTGLIPGQLSGSYSDILTVNDLRVLLNL